MIASIPIQSTPEAPWQIPVEFPFQPLYQAAAVLGIPIQIVEACREPVRVFVGYERTEAWLPDVPWGADNLYYIAQERRAR